MKRDRFGRQIRERRVRHCFRKKTAPDRTVIERLAYGLLLFIACGPFIALLLLRLSEN